MNFFHVLLTKLNSEKIPKTIPMVCAQKRKKKRFVLCRRVKRNLSADALVDNLVFKKNYCSYCTGFL